MSAYLHQKLSAVYNQRKMVLFLSGFFAGLICATGLDTAAFSEDKIYTNADLKQEPSSSVASTYPLDFILKDANFNSSFTELHEYIKEKLTRIRIPEYKAYLRPLFAGMTIEQIKQLWGIKIKRGIHEHNDLKTVSADIIDYEIGISLYFKNNELKGWRVCTLPHCDTTKGANTIDYKDLMKDSNTSEKIDKERLQEPKEYRD